MDAISKSKFLTVLVLVILQGGTIVLLCNWYIQFSPEATANSHGQVHILLLTSWRSGSTFMGFMFNLHPSVFYIREPLWNLYNRLDIRSVLTLQWESKHTLQSEFHCNFSETQKSYQGRSEILSMWQVAHKLCKPLICPKMPPHQETNHALCNQLCGSSMMENLEKTCRTSKHLVFKVVRLFELESIFPLLEDPGLDLRVIHLVRDPRAVYLSRAKKGIQFKNTLNNVLGEWDIPFEEAQFKAMEKICQSQLRINRRAVLNPPPFLKGRYELVRYEDVVRDPLQEMNKLYNFVDMTMTEELRHSIYSWTHGKIESTFADASPRDAKVMSQKWRTEMDHDKVLRVQELCKDSMSLFGYRNVTSKVEQKNLDVDLLLPL